MRKDRAGFTLIEVAIATAMLGIVVLALMSTSARMIRSVTDDRARTLATASADARLALVRQWPQYATIDSVYAGSEADTPEIGWSRVTAVTRVGGTGQPTDFKRVTVAVSGPGLPIPITRSITVAAP